MGNMKTDIMEWLSDITNGDTKNAIAVRAGLPTSTLNRQWNTEKFSADVVISISRAYGASPIDGLRELGVIDDDDIARLRSDDALRDASDDQLLQELARRLSASHDEIMRDPASEWNSPIPFIPAANHDDDKNLGGGADEEFA